MPSFPAHLVATPVLERLTGPLEGVVLGAGATAAWVDLDGFVVAVTTREVPLLPNAVALGAGSGALLGPGLAAGTRARLAPGRVELGALQVTWDPAAPPSWDPTVRVPRAVGPEAIAARAAALHRTLGAVDSHGNPPLDRATLPLRGPQQPGVGVSGAPDLLFQAVRERDPGQAAGAAHQLLGHGPGLTPEGDDLLAAVAGTLAVLGPLAGWDRRVLGGFLAALVAPARARTTALSATLLELAARGQLAEAAGRLLDLSPDGEAAWPAALARLGRLGHGSGRAYTAGIAATTGLLASGPAS